MYNIVKPFNIRWECTWVNWGSCKQAQNITITTLWAATTTNRHTENLCEKIIVNTLTNGHKEKRREWEQK